MFLGIEIGGTKLQFGLGTGDGRLTEPAARLTVDRGRGAEGILAQIADLAPVLIARHRATAIGVGFGGPVDAIAGRVVKSHHVSGWDDFPLTAWLQDRFGIPARMHNDCDAAGLAEALYGAGRDRRVVFYVTVGTGIGGGLIIDRKIYRGGGHGAAEIGHLRPGLDCESESQIIESMAAGWGIEANAQRRLNARGASPLIPFRRRLRHATDEEFQEHLAATEQASAPDIDDLLARCDSMPERLTTKIVAEAALDGNLMARQIVAEAAHALGWAIAQAATLVAPNRFVLGGGVAQMDRSLLLDPLQKEVERYLFPPLVGKFDIVPAELGEEVVVHGALAIAAGEG